MRILLKKGKQSELIQKERALRNLSWKDFAKELNLKPGKLNAFAYEESLIDTSTFNKMKLKGDYERFIEKKLNENWGQIKGGHVSPGNTKEISIPKRTMDLAEFWGIVLGDGNVQKTKGYKIGTYNVNITGHSVLDKEYLFNFVKPLGEKLFKIKGRYRYSNFANALNISFDSRKIVEFFETENFPSGDKIRNQVGIPDWIKENPSYLAACLRGLLDTDGCFYKLTNQNSHQVCFTNKNNALLNDVRKGFLSLGINCSKISKNKDITITKKEEIAKFYKLVGFHNPKHLDKINAYFKAL